MGARKKRAGALELAAADVASDLKGVIAGARVASIAVLAWRWLDTDKALGGALAREAIARHAPPAIGRALAERWANRGLAVRVVKGPPPHKTKRLGGRK